MKPFRIFAVLLVLTHGSVFALAQPKAHAKTSTMLWPIRSPIPVCTSEPASFPLPGALPSYLRITSDQLIGVETILKDVEILVGAGQRIDLECRLLVRMPEGPDDVATGLTAYLVPITGLPALAEISADDGRYGTSVGFINVIGVIEGGSERSFMAIKVQSRFGPGSPVLIRKGSWCRYNAY